MTTLTRTVVASAATSLAAFFTASACAGDLLSIRTIAPQKSIVVLGVDDINATKERFNRTPLAGWWNSKEVQDASKDWREEMEKGIEKMTQELGVPRETVTWPASAGLAIYAELNEESGTEEPAFVAFIDWGAEGEKFAKLYDAATAKLEKEKATPFKVEEVKGHRVYVFGGELEAAGDQDKKDADGEDEEMDFGSDAPFGLDTCVVTRDNGRLLAASGLAQMEDLLASVEGDKGKKIADSDDFKGSMELVGGNPDAYGVVLLGSLSSLMGPMAGPEMAMVTPFMSKLFGDVRGFSMGLALDGKRAPLEQTMGLYVPGPKVGLLALPMAGSVEKAPSIVPADSISYGRFNLKISEFAKVVDDMVESLPEMQRDQVKQMTDPFMPAVRTAFAAMGPGVHMWSTVKQPVTEDSERTTYAIGVTDQKAAQSLLQTFGPMMGMAPRDFLGNTVFSAEGDPAAVGYGGSFMFMGQTESVEQALRALGAGDAASIESDLTYKASMAHIKGDDLVGYGFSNTIASLELQKQLLSQVDEMLGESGAAEHGMDAVPIDPQKSMEVISKLMTPELAKEFFGPSIWAVRSVKTGFRAEFDLLPPTKDAPKGK